MKFDGASGTASRGSRGSACRTARTRLRTKLSARHSREATLEAALYSTSTSLLSSCQETGGGLWLAPLPSCSEGRAAGISRLVGRLARACSREVEENVRNHPGKPDTETTVGSTPGAKAGPFGGARLNACVAVVTSLKSSPSRDRG